MTQQKQMTTEEFDEFINGLTHSHYRYFFKRHKTFFLTYYSTEIYKWFKEIRYNDEWNTVQYPKEKFLTMDYISFIQGIISQDPRFLVFYGIETYGQHIFETTYKTLEGSSASKPINYEQIGQYHLQHDKNIYHLDIDRHPKTSGLILVLKNEYHNYYN